MSNPKFTPGPWYVENGVPGKPRIFSSAKNLLKSIVCECIGARSRRKHDAALIAAAPEMFNELQDICNMCKRGEFEVEPTSRRIHGICEKCTIGNITKKARG